MYMHFIGLGAVMFDKLKAMHWISSNFPSDHFRLNWQE